MSLAVDETALDELAVDEMAVDDLTPHRSTLNSSYRDKYCHYLVSQLGNGLTYGQERVNLLSDVFIFNTSFSS